MNPNKTSPKILRTQAGGRAANNAAFKGSGISDEDFEEVVNRTNDILRTIKNDWKARELTVWVFDDFTPLEELKADYVARGFSLDDEKKEELQRRIGLASATALVGNRPMIIISKRSSDDTIFHELAHVILTPETRMQPTVKVGVDGKRNARLSCIANQTVRSEYGVVRDMLAYRLYLDYPEYGRQRLKGADHYFQLKSDAYRNTIEKNGVTEPLAFHLIFSDEYLFAVLAGRLGDTQLKNKVLANVTDLQLSYVKKMKFASEAEREQFRSDVELWYNTFDEMFGDKDKTYRELVDHYLVPLLEDPMQYGLPKGTRIKIKIR